MATVLVIGASKGSGSAPTRGLTAAKRAVHLAGRDKARPSTLAAELDAGDSACDALDPPA